MAHLSDKYEIIRSYLPTGLAFLLAVALALSWFGAQALVFALPFVFLAFIPLSQRPVRNYRGAGGAAKGAQDMRATIDSELSKARKKNQSFACILLCITPTQITPQTLIRLRRSLRPEDRIFDLQDGRIGLLLAPVPGLDDPALVRLGRRLQGIVEEQVFSDDAPLRPVASLALCLAPAEGTRSGTALLDGLTVTLEEAARSGPSALLLHNPAPHLGS